jgi:hypothetical protein
MPASAATPTLESRLIRPDVLPAGIKTKKWRFTTVASGDWQALGTVEGRVAGAEVQYDNVLGYKSQTTLPFDFVVIRLVRFESEAAAHRAFLRGRGWLMLSPWGKLGQESARTIKPGNEGNVVRTLWRFRDIVAVAWYAGRDRHLRERILRAQQERLR